MPNRYGQSQSALRQSSDCARAFSSVRSRERQEREADQDRDDQLPDHRPAGEEQDLVRDHEGSRRHDRGRRQPEGARPRRVLASQRSEGERHHRIGDNRSGGNETDELLPAREREKEHQAAEERERDCDDWRASWREIELSSRYPNEGGIYVWTKRAFGDFSGFMSAWTYWTCNLPYFPAVLYFAASNALFIRQDSWGHLSNNTTYYILFSLVALTVATVFNVFGLDVGTWLHNLGALAMWIPICIIVGMGAVAWHLYGSATTFTFIPWSRAPISTT